MDNLVNLSKYGFGYSMCVLSMHETHIFQCHKNEWKISASIIEVHIACDVSYGLGHRNSVSTKLQTRSRNQCYPKLTKQIP